MEGFYALSQLYSTRETKRQKQHTGIFPFGSMTIRRMWERGEFPKPMKLYERLVWRKAIIDEFCKLLVKGVEPAEAVIQAEAAVA